MVLIPSIGMPIWIEIDHHLYDGQYERRDELSFSPLYALVSDMIGDKVEDNVNL